MIGLYSQSSLHGWFHIRVTSVPVGRVLRSGCMCGFAGTEGGETRAGQACAAQPDTSDLPAALECSCCSASGLVPHLRHGLSCRYR